MSSCTTRINLVGKNTLWKNTFFDCLHWKIEVQLRVVWSQLSENISRHVANEPSLLQLNCPKAPTEGKSESVTISH